MIGVDSSVFIDILTNSASAVKLRPYSHEEFCTSEIVVYEILTGVYAAKHFNETRLLQLEELLDSMTHIFPIDRKASFQAARIAGHLSRAGRIIDDSDILIAGSLSANGCTAILTKNIKDFQRIQGLKVVPF